MRSTRLWPGVLSILLLLCLGIGLVSAALPDDVDDSGYYDGDGDDAAVAPERLTMWMDLAVGARATAMPVRTPEAFESPAAPIAAPVVEQSSPPLLRSPPLS